MTPKAETKGIAVQTLWNNGFSIGDLMHLFGLTRKQARKYILSTAIEELIRKRSEERECLLIAQHI